MSNLSAPSNNILFMVEIMSETEPNAEQKPAPSPSTTKTTETSTSFSLPNLLSFIAFVLVITAAYFYYQDRGRQQGNIDTLVSQQQSTAARQQEVIQQLQIQLRTMQDSLVKQQEEQQAIITGLTDQVIASSARLAKLDGQSQRSWYLDEAYYLLRMANNRIIFLQDIKTALLLVDQADMLLARVDDVELFSVRQKLAEDRQRLTAITPVDRTGTAIRLGAIQGRVDNLPLQKLLYQQRETEAEAVEPASTWYEHLANSMAKLGEQWFEVRKHSPGYNPLMTEAEAQQLRYVVLLTVQTAQYAVLHQDGNLYQASLLQLRSRLSNYFDSEDPEVQAVLTEVAALLDIPVASEPVAGLHTLSLLQAFLEQRRNAESESTP